MSDEPTANDYLPSDDVAWDEGVCLPLEALIQMLISS